MLRHKWARDRILLNTPFGNFPYSVVEQEPAKATEKATRDLKKGSSRGRGSQSGGGEGRRSSLVCGTRLKMDRNPSGTRGEEGILEGSEVPPHLWHLWVVGRNFIGEAVLSYHDTLVIEVE